MDQRQDTLAQWAADQIEQLYQHSIPAQMVTVSGDASFRRYFRINHNEKGTTFTSKDEVIFQDLVGMFSSIIKFLLPVTKVNFS